MRSSKLAGKVAIVTGSSRGIGKVVAMLLAQKGVKVVINGRNPNHLEATKIEFEQNNLHVTAIEADVTDHQACEQLINQTVQAFGKLDILINNAGISMEGSIAESQPHVFKKLIETNLVGQLFPTQAALPHIVQTKGSIVFISSIAGLIGLPRFAAYSSSKMALTALTQSLRIENYATDIHIGLSYLGFVENEKNKTFLNKDGELELMPDRKSFAKMPVDKVAFKIVRGIELRRKNEVFSMIGKLLSLTQRFFPRVLEYLMIRAYQKQQKPS